MMEQVVLLDISSVDLVSWAIRTSKFETRTTLQKKKHVQSNPLERYKNIN